MEPIEVPQIADDFPSYDEDVDWEDFRTPHHILKYGVVGWCLCHYKLLGHTDRSLIPMLHDIAANVRQQQESSDADELATLRADEERMRQHILDVYIAYVCDPKTTNAFTNERTAYLLQSCSSAILYSVAHALPDRYPDPRNLMWLNSWGYIEGYLKAYNNFCSDSYNLLDYTIALIDTAVEYFRRLQMGLMNGSIQLDLRYRYHLRKSLLAAFDRIRDDLGDEYWNKKFPQRDPNDCLPETRSYDVNDLSTVYDWPVDELPETGQIVFQQPYAPVLERHQRGRLKVVLDLLDGFQSNLLDRERKIALLICFETKAAELLHEMGVSKQDYFNMFACANADLTAICSLVCQRYNSDRQERQSRNSCCVIC